MATFDEKRALTSRKSVVVQDMNIPISTQKNNFFWSHSSFFFRIIASKMLIFEVRLHLKIPLVTTLIKTRGSLPEIMKFKKD